MKQLKYLVIISVLLYAKYSSSFHEDDANANSSSNQVQNNSNSSNVGFENLPKGNEYTYTNFAGEKILLTDHQFVDVVEGQELVFRYNENQLVIFTPYSKDDVINILDSEGKVLGTTNDDFGYTQKDGEQYIVRFKIISAKKFGAGIFVKKINN